MFQRFASALFGDDVEELRCSRSGDGKEEEEDEEDWILVNYLAEACAAQSVEEDEEDLVMIPSPMASPPIRYASCTSLNSTADNDPDGGAEEEEDNEDEEESGFLRLDACSLEESWFVTPPPCFTGRGSQPVLLETSPLENLLIEHPSMSVYAHRSPPRLSLDPLPRSLDMELGLLPVGNVPAALTPSTGKEKGRRTLDGQRHSNALLLSLSPPAGRRWRSFSVAPASTQPATLRHSPPAPASCISGRVTPPNAPNRCPATPCAASTCCAPRRSAPCTCTSPARDTSTSEASRSPPSTSILHAVRETNTGHL